MREFRSRRAEFAGLLDVGPLGDPECWPWDDVLAYEIVSTAPLVVRTIPPGEAEPLVAIAPFRRAELS